MHKIAQQSFGLKEKSNDFMETRGPAFTRLTRGMLKVEKSTLRQNT